MKKSLIFLLVLFFVTITSLCDALSANQTNKTLATNSFKLDEHTIQIKHPQEWEFKKNSKEDNTFTIYPKTHDSMCFIKIRNLPEHLSNQDFQRFFQENLQTSAINKLFGLDDFILSQTTIDGLPAAITKFNTYIDNLFFYHIISYIGYQNTIFVLKCCTFNQNKQQAKISFENSYNDFLYFINSFKLINDTQPSKTLNLTPETENIINSINNNTPKQARNNAILQQNKSKTNSKQIDFFGIKHELKRDPHMNVSGYIFGKIFGGTLLLLFLYKILRR